VFEGATTPMWLDWLRVPSACVDGLVDGDDVVLTWSANGRRLAWTRALHEATYELHALDGIPFYARGVASEAPAWASEGETIATVTRAGAPVAFVRRTADGGIFLPFDPDDAIRALQTESYVSAGDATTRESAKGLARRAYYRLRPLIPRSLQLSLRRAFSRVQRRRSFPAWPVEPALHDLVERLLAFAADVADEPLPWIAPWPHPYTWAFVLTHDVETSVGYARIDELCREEAQLGYRSAWNLVPERDYTVEDTLVRRLWEGGWEVGLHGLHHDGRDLESERLLAARLPRMREWADRWGATGFRAPATQRSWALMRTLGFDYDSSYPDTDPFEPQGGGCCSWLPFFNGDLLELPITLPQDHTLFELLRDEGADRWLTKAELLRGRGGMALLDTHPDYLGGDPARSAYRTVLHSYANDPSSWRALPNEVAAWWRRRAATTIVRDRDQWRVVGPAEDDAVVAYAAPQAA
jgi:peptidoglycan/xylan/chitin deacetylase (PgdA/CDA1 family)